MPNQPQTDEWAVRHAQGTYTGANHPLTEAEARAWAADNQQRDANRRPEARGKTQLLRRTVTRWVEVPESSTDAGHVEAISARKPVGVGTATVRVAATNATYDQVLDAGLTALRETRDALFGYGIKGLPRRDAPELLTGTFVVYADRD